MRRKGIFLLVVALAFSLLVIPAFARTFVSIATGGTGGTYYPLGGGMAEIFNEHLSDVIATSQSTGASVENVRLVDRREVELALVQNDITYYSYNAAEMFAERDALTNLAGVAILYPEVIQIVTLENRGINSVRDFAGKRVAVGAPGSGTEANARQIIEAHGLSYADMRVDYLSFAEAVDQLRDGHVDVAFLTAGLPTAAVMDLATSHDVKMVEVDADALEALRANYPFYTAHNIGSSAYGTDAVVTVAVQAMLIVSKDLDTELVYNMTKALFENLPRMAQVHAMGGEISVDTALDGMPIPLHPGATRYFEESHPAAYEAVKEALDSL